MPYIPQDRRELFLSQLDSLAGSIETDGDYNYVVSRLFVALLHKRGISYTAANALLGVLGEAQAEMRRKYLVPYEEEKEAENGPIWP